MWQGWEGVEVAEPEGFRDFVASRSRSLLRFGWVLTGDWHAAQDLVQSALLKSWRRWDSITRRDDPEVYVRQVMVNTQATWWRRRWRGEIPFGVLPENAEIGDSFALSDDQNALHSVLGMLPSRQRAVIALRYLEDLDETRVASLLGCSVSTVKSQSAKAIAKLRADPQIADLLAGVTE